MDTVEFIGIHIMMYGFIFGVIGFITVLYVKDMREAKRECRISDPFIPRWVLVWMWIMVALVMTGVEFLTWSAYLRRREMSERPAIEREKDQPPVEDDGTGGDLE